MEFLPKNKLPYLAVIWLGPISFFAMLFLAIGQNTFLPQIPDHAVLSATLLFPTYLVAFCLASRAVRKADFDISFKQMAEPDLERFAVNGTPYGFIRKTRNGWLAYTCLTGFWGTNAFPSATIWRSATAASPEQAIKNLL